jgi:polyketide cyclase/dehydrase/lipid transport protein
LDEEIDMAGKDSNLAYCLGRIGKSAAGWDTLVVRGSAEATEQAEDLWAVWADVERWPAWSPLHRRVTRKEAGALAAGATFRQEIQLGFPVGTTSETVTLTVLEPARRAVWEGKANGIRNCHLWTFSPLPGGGTRIENIEVFAGLPVGLLRPVVTRRWNRAFQVAVDGLIRRTASGAGVRGQSAE